MDKAGWIDLWHIALAVIARQPPFAAIMIVTGVAFVAVMAIEGTRTSLVAIWHAHRTPPALERPKQAPGAAAPPAPATANARSFSVRRGPQAAATLARKRKPLTTSARPFRSPRPTIRRHAALDFAAATETLHAPDLQPEGI